MAKGCHALCVSQAQAVAAIKSVRVLLMWAKHDKAVPFQPSFDRWQAILGTAGESVEYEVSAGI
jgi:hypothetical protein